MAEPGDIQTNPSRAVRALTARKAEGRTHPDWLVNGKTSQDEELEGSRRFRLLDRIKDHADSSF